MDNNGATKKFDNPLDSSFSAASRFGIELVAWVAGPWAAADLLGTWLVTIPALAILVTLSEVFSTTGDKRHVVVTVPGRIRFLIEVILAVVVIASALLVWTVFGAVIVAIVAAVMFIAGAPRARWLLSNEPHDWPLPNK